jgi:hypothetical protein
VSTELDIKLDVFAGDTIGVPGTSLTRSNTVTPVTSEAIYKWYYDADRFFERKFARPGLGPGDVLVQGITQYRNNPTWLCGGVIGATMPDIVTMFRPMVGQFSPSLVIIDGGANDVPPAVSFATFATRAASLAAAVLSPANYGTTGLPPPAAISARQIAWMALIARADEKWTDSVQTPALGNTNSGNASIAPDGANGDLFLNVTTYTLPDFTDAWIGGSVVIAGATNPANNGTFPIVGRIANQRLVLSRSSGVFVTENLDVTGKSVTITSPQPDPRITQCNAIIQAQCATSGFAYIDSHSLVFSQAPKFNPGNAATGFATWDGTHFTGPNGPHGDIGVRLVSQALTDRCILHL